MEEKVMIQVIGDNDEIVFSHVGNIPKDLLDELLQRKTK